MFERKEKSGKIDLFRVRVWDWEVKNVLKGERGKGTSLAAL